MVKKLLLLLSILTISLATSTFYDNRNKIEQVNSLPSYFAIHFN